MACYSWERFYVGLLFLKCVSHLSQGKILVNLED